jgi:hypothetical protein
MLRLAPGSDFEGRVLDEALRDGPVDAPGWARREETVSFIARGQAWAQRVWFERVGSTEYLAGGAVESARGECGGG